jgi:Subtilase family.
MIEGGYTDNFAGTSSATPHVSGVAALILSVNPCLTREEVKYIIEATCTKIRQDVYTYSNNPNHPNGTWNIEVGHGLVNAGDAVALAQQMGGYTYVKDTVISSSVSWNTNRMINQDLYIDSLATLTITDTLYVGNNARIVVRPGGRLVVDGGILTSACSDEMWQGIFVEGHRSMHQTPENQGKVTLRNGAVIENALCAIRTSAPDGDSLSSGGLVFATNSTFRNNCKSVDFLPYADTIGDSATIGNLGSFTRCTFTVDDDNLFAANDTSFVAHATLWDVYGVSFLGCTFTNATAGATADRGYAIRAMDAGFHVATQCDTLFTDPEEACQCPENKATYSSFSGFQTAVQAGTTGNAYPLTVDEARFTNNGIGVSVAGNNHATVTRCDFDLDNCPGDVTKCTGLHLNGCTGYLVEENNFHRTAVSSPLPIEGIYVANSGTAANTLHRNSFSHLQEAVRVAGTNGGYHDPAGLELSCNTFEGDMCDIYVAVNSNMARQQGSASVGADNSFAGTTGSSLYNAGYQTIDYYFFPGTNHLPYTTTNVNTRKSLAANACLSTLCTPANVIPSGPIKSPDAGYLALKDQYDTLLSAYESRGYAGILADPSEDLHSQADIVSARHCFARLAEVGRELYAQSYTAVRRLQGDTVLDLPALKSWFAATPGLSSRYSLAETEFLSGEDNTMTLQGVPALLTTPEERDEYDNYMAFNALKEALSGSIPGHVNWPAATETQITELQRIAEAGTGRASVMARGVLCFFFGICYDDVEVTAETRRVVAKDGEGIPGYPNVSMKIYPNPARNTLHVEFEGTDDPQGTLTVTNVTGVVMLTRECHDPVTKLDVSHLASGLYVVSFRNEKGVMVRKFVKL